MAQTIQIKRGTGSAVPSGLADGELAINLDNRRLYFGSGSTSVNDFSFGEITAEKYIVSSSVTNYTFQTLSGSSDFGDDIADIHKRTGSLNISGALNVVGNIAGTLSTAAQTNITSVGTLTNLVVDNVQINSNAINSTSDTDVFFSMGTAGLGFEANNGDKFEFNSAQNNVDFQYNGENDGTLLYIDASADKVGIGVSTPGEKLTVTGNISASGNILGGIYYTNNQRSLYNIGGTLNVGDGVGSVTVPQLKSTSHITASGNISASGKIYSGEFYGEGDPSAIGSRVIEATTTEHNFGSAARITKMLGTAITLNAPVTASGNISSSGNLLANAISSYNHNIGFWNGASISLGYENNTPIQIGKLANPTTIVGNVTASGNISSSGGINSNNLHINGYNTANSTGTSLRLGYDNSLTTLTYGKDSDTSHFFYGTAITASGNISASGEIKANTLDIVSTSNFADDITLGDTKKLKGIRIVISASQNNNIYGATTFNDIISGDTTLQGNLRIGGAGDTSNNWISIDCQNGNDSSGGGITFYETGTYDVDSPQYGAKIVYNEDDDEFAIGTMDNNTFKRQIYMKRNLDYVYLADAVFAEGTTPSLILSDTSTTVADGDTVGNIGWRNEDDDSYTLNIKGIATEDHASNSAGGSKLEFYVTPNTTSDLALAATINHDKSLLVTNNISGSSVSASGDISAEGTIKAGWHGSTTRIKILVSDFIPDDVGRPAMIDDTGSDRWLESHSTGKLFASIPIPTGFKATHVHIYGSATSALEVYEADINSKTVTSKGTGNIGTELDITDVTSDTTNYLLLELAQASGEEVYGGYVTIEAV